MTKKGVSLDTVMAITGLSKRTVWRRIAEGSLRKVAEEARGRVLLDADEVLWLVPHKLAAVDAALLCRADAGDAEAQNDIGMACHEEGDVAGALYWWRRAAQAGHADAMQWLGQACAAGEGVPQDTHLALMWISKAAGGGHAIARAQVEALWGRPGQKAGPW